MYKAKLNKIFANSESENLVIKALSERKIDLKAVMSKNEQSNQMEN